MKMTTTTTKSTSTTVQTSTTTSVSGPTQSHWGQCGGNGYGGPTVCASPYTCKFQNPYYSQCL
jgi:cellulase